MTDYNKSGGSRLEGTSTWDSPSRSPLRKPPIRNIYLVGYGSSLVTSTGFNLRDVARHDAIIRLAPSTGTFDIEVGDYQGPASVAITGPRQRFSARGEGAGFLTLIVHVNNPRFRKLRLHVDGRAYFPPAAAFARFDERIRSACSHYLSIEEANELFEDVLDVALADAKRAPPIDLRVPWVMRKLDWNVDHPFEELAQELGLSPSRLSHLFTDELGLSFRSYQAWVRRRRAWEMVVMRPDLTITQVAQAMGYADAAHLSRTFNSNLGFTPSAMRDRRQIAIFGMIPPPGRHIPSDEEWMSCR